MTRPFLSDGSAAGFRRTVITLCILTSVGAGFTSAGSAQSGPIPQGLTIPSDDDDDYPTQVRRHLSIIGDDRARALAGTIDPTGYIRSDFDGLPPQVLDGFPLIGATIRDRGLDPNDPNRVMREIRFNDQALIKFGSERYQSGDQLTLFVSIANAGRGMMRLSKAELAQVVASPAEHDATEKNPAVDRR